MMFCGNCCLSVWMMTWHEGISRICSQISRALAFLSTAMLPFSFLPSSTLYPSTQKVSMESLVFTFLFCAFFGKSSSILAISFASCTVLMKSLMCSIFERSDSSSMCRCFARCFAFLLFVKNISLMLKGVACGLSSSISTVVPS